MSGIQEVAKRAGVSTATVSRALSRPDVVSPDTRRKVLRAVEHLGYAPNSAARHLRTLRSRKLLVTVPDISNPFFSQILQGIEDTAQRDGYAVLVGDTQHDIIRENGYAQMLMRKEADGLIFFGHHLPKQIVDLVRAASPQYAPVVSSATSSRLGVPSVQIDNTTAAAEAMDHLYRLGHRRIGIVTGPLVGPLSKDRLAGVQARAKAAGAQRECVVLHGDFSIASGAAAGERLLKSRTPPTAVFCFNDEMAMGVLETARRRQVHVPRDLSVVGFDDIRFASHTDPPLTTIAQPMRDIGEATARLLLDILAGTPIVQPSITVPHALVVRDSTGRAGRPAL